MRPDNAKFKLVFGFEPMSNKLTARGDATGCEIVRRVLERLGKARTRTSVAFDSFAESFDDACLGSVSLIMLRRLRKKWGELREAARVAESQLFKAMRLADRFGYLLEGE